MSIKATLKFEPESCKYILKQCSGGSLGLTPKGVFESAKSRGGAETKVDLDDAGLPTRIYQDVVQDGVATTVERLIERIDSGENAGLVRSVTAGRSRNPAIQTRRMVYAYYETGDEHGSAGDLKTATEQILVGTTWVDKHTAYYRYYKAGDPNGFEGGMKYALDPDAFDRLKADPGVGDPFLATDAQVAAYADNYFEYDAEQRVTKSIVRAGLLEYTYAYETSVFADGVNSWKTRVEETRPDGSVFVTYSNYLQQELLTELASNSDSWIDYRQYDADGNEILHAHASAVSSYDDSSADLDVALRPSSGLIEWKEYYDATTATESTPGGVEGELKALGVQEGSSGTPIKTREIEYFVRTVSGQSVFPLATSTVYRETNGTGAIETSFAYEWHSGTCRSAPQMNRDRQA